VSAWKLNGSPQVPVGVVVTTAAQKAIGLNNWNAANQYITLVATTMSSAISKDRRERSRRCVTSAGITTVNFADSTLYPSTWGSFDTTTPYPKNNNFFGPGGRVINDKAVTTSASSSSRSKTFSSTPPPRMTGITIISMTSCLGTSPAE